MVGELFVCLSELPGHVTGSAVKVRLVYSDDFAATHHAACCAECGGNLGRMVSVVVVNSHATHRAVKLEPAFGARECRDTVQRFGRVKTQPDEHRECPGRVERVVVTGNGENCRVILPLPRDLEGDRAVGDHGMQAHICCGILTECQHLAMVEHARHPHRTRVVAGHHHELFRTLGKRHEGSIERVMAAVVVEMICVDIRDERHGRVIQQERSIGFVGLHDEELPLTE